MLAGATFAIRFHDLKAIFDWIQTTAVWWKSDKMLVVCCVDNHSLLHTSMTRCVMKEMCTVYRRAKRASLLSCQLSSRYIIFIYLYIYMRTSVLVIWIYGKTERRIEKRQCQMNAILTPQHMCKKLNQGSLSRGRLN